MINLHAMRAAIKLQYYKREKKNAFNIFTDEFYIL